jgi:CheY-like chemotaxis protein
MKRTILTVEDCKALQYLITTVLQSKYNVKNVETSYQAMQLLVADFETDLIILDIPSMKTDNTELLEHISTSSILRSIPVVVLSASGDPALENELMKLGASAFFRKPFDPVMLKEKIDELLAGKMPLVIEKKKKIFNLNIF